MSRELNSYREALHKALGQFYEIVNDLNNSNVKDFEIVFKHDRPIVKMPNGSGGYNIVQSGPQVISLTVIDKRKVGRIL